MTGEQNAIRRFIFGKVLGHTAHEGAAVTSVYDRNEYLSEKRTALDAWGRHVVGLLQPAPPRPEGRRLRLVKSA